MRNLSDWFLTRVRSTSRASMFGGAMLALGLFGLAAPATPGWVAALAPIFLCLGMHGFMHGHGGCHKKESDTADTVGEDGFSFADTGRSPKQIARTTTASKRTLQA